MKNALRLAAWRSCIRGGSRHSDNKSSFKLEEEYAAPGLFAMVRMLPRQSIKFVIAANVILP